MEQNGAQMIRRGNDVKISKLCKSGIYLQGAANRSNNRAELATSDRKMKTASTGLLCVGTFFYGSIVGTG
jgi:hypothetical protein